MSFATAFATTKTASGCDPKSPAPYNYAATRVPQLQEEEVEKAAGRGYAIAFTPGDEKVSEIRKRMVQRPRAFYRRELEAAPVVVGKR